MTARILNVGIAILAGAIAVVGLMVRLDIALPVPVYTGIAVAVGLNTLGTAETAFLLSGARHRPQWAFGPDLAGLDARLDDPDWREDDLNRSLVRSYVGASGLNLEGIARLVIGRRSALGKLALSVIGYLGAFAYILARGI
ncbi:MAG: hypothetical protein KY455_07640 [Euryarchaeota archaeon]|nr:hypothetical protein [Euryarchaeota archaeon]